MEIISKGTRVNVEELKLRLLQQKSIKPRFRFDLTEEETVDLLHAAYIAEVTYRRRQYVDNDEIMKVIKHLACYMTTAYHKFGVMFCGTCGNGKTTLMYALRSLINMLNDYGMFGNSQEAQETFLMIRDAKEISNLGKNPQVFNQIKNKQLLGIEDMGREPTEIIDYGNILNPIIDLLEYRYNEQLFTVISTNLTSEQIVEKYGRRIADRFNEMLEVIIFANPTFRK